MPKLTPEEVNARTGMSAAERKQAKAEKKAANKKAFREARARGEVMDRQGETKYHDAMYNQPVFATLPDYGNDPFAFPSADLKDWDFSEGLPPQADPFEVAALDFEPKPDYDQDPVQWGKDRLGEFYWSKQAEILLSLRDNRYTSVKSCHGAGKSYIAARAIAKWIDTHEPGEAFVVSTAPTSAQVSAILWRELQKAHGKGALTGTITISGYPQWKIPGGELVGYGRKPADYSDSAFQGIHARYVLVVLDEAGGIPENLFNAVDALATNANARVLAIGNPDDPTSHFAKICKANSGWNVIRIDGLRTPNFTQEAVEWLDCEQCRTSGRDGSLLNELFQQEGIPYSDEFVPESLRDMLISPLWVEERLHRWVGEPTGQQTIAEAAATSSLFSAKVRGLFPDSNTEGVIPLGWIELAIQRWHDWADKGKPAPQGNMVLGVDPASTGEDQTAMARRVGQVVTEIITRRTADTMVTTGQVAAVLSDPRAVAVIDSIGIGVGIIDRLREQRYPVQPFTASASARGLFDKSGEFGFQNLRAAAWWNLREMLDPSRGATLCLPDDESLKADLATPKWKVLSGGKIQIESKDDIRKRLGRSTDSGDSVVMSVWVDSYTMTGAEGEDGVVSWYSESDEGALSWGVDADIPQF